MLKESPHTFHIPVMGIGFTIDSPVKVARFGITSVVSIMEDHLIEAMRKVICTNFKKPYHEIASTAEDHRAKRITAYLDLMDEVIQDQMETMKRASFENDSELNKYFQMLPEHAYAKIRYHEMLAEKDDADRIERQKELKLLLIPGAIDVNIMTKVDKSNFDNNGQALPIEYSDALSALRGFCNSKLSSAVIFSAGMNPRLFAYCEQFDDFFPDQNGGQRKRIILKVSDYRSALVQGKIFAKKGIWISEYRIESGLNCGGHAFATQGYLLGPILEEFKEKKTELTNELFSMCNEALVKSGRNPLKALPYVKITAQGGIGNAGEDEFLMQHYALDGTGWGSPFLLVPETTNVDDNTLSELIKAQRDDFYLSDASPLGVRFNNFRNSSSQKLRQARIASHRPGSPCYKEFLAIDTEFTEKPICTASRRYQHLKVEQIEHSDASLCTKEREIAKILEKECLCEGLGSSARITNHAPLSHKITAVSICPGPNLSYFGRIYQLTEMVDHIYGRFNLIFKNYRPHMFINEAQLYIDYLAQELESQFEELSEKKKKYYDEFKTNLESGLNYYKELAASMHASSKERIESFVQQIDQLKNTLAAISVTTHYGVS